MQKHLLLLSAVLIIATASPKPYYREHYKYDQQSESFKNNELQHKTEEAGRYAKIEDGTSAPIERSAFHQSEYHAPNAEDDGTKAKLSLSGGPTSQSYQKSSSFRREWSTHGGDLDQSSLGHGQQLHGTAGIASQSLANAASESQNRRYLQSTQDHMRIQEIPAQLPSSYRRELNQQASYNAQGGSHPGRGHAYGHQIGRGNPHRVHGYDDTQTAEATASQSSVSHSITEQKAEIGSGRGHAYGHQIGRGNPHRVHGYDDTQTADAIASQSSVSQSITEQKEEIGYVAQQNQQSQGNGRGRGHGHGRGRGHYEHGRGNGYGQQKYDQESEYAPSYPDNTNTQTDQVPSTGNIYHSTGTNGAGSVYYQAGTNSASQTRLTSTGTNRQPINNDDTTGLYGTVPQKPSGIVLVPSTSGTGAVTHQTSRTFTSQSKLSGISTVPQSTVPQNTDTTQTNRNYGRTTRVHLQPVIVASPGYVRSLPKLPTTTENIRSVYEQPAQEVDRPSSDAQIVGNRRLTPVLPTTSHQTSHQSAFQSFGSTRTTNTQQNVEDLTQHNDDLEDYQDITQQKDLTRSLTQQTEDEFDDQQTQHGFDDLTQHSFDHSTQQIQKGYKIIPITIQNNQKPITPTSYQPDSTPIQNDYKYTPNTFQPNNEKPASIDQSRYSHHRRYQTQRVEKTEFAEQPVETVTQEPQTPESYWKRRTTQQPIETVTQEPQVAEGYWRTYQAQQNKSQQIANISPQRPAGYRNINQQPHEEPGQDLKQQHEDVFGNQHEGQTLHRQEGHFEFSSQHKVVPVPQTQYQQPQHGTGKIINFSQQNKDLTQRTQTGYEDFPQKTDNLGTATNTNDNHDSSYSSSNSFSAARSYSAQQHPQVVYSPIQVGSQAGQLQVYQTMQIPAGASEELRQQLQEQLRQRLEQKMQELQSQQQTSQRITFSPVHIGTQRGTGQLQVYQTMQMPAGATQELRHKMEEQLRQQLQLKMQELKMQQGEFYQRSTGPISVQSYSTGAEFGADCDDQTGGFVSSSYTSSSGSVGGNHYAMKLRPSGSSYSMGQQVQQPHLFTHKGY